MYTGRLQNGQEIAIKRLDFNYIHFGQEFINNVSLLVKLEHENLVQLLGYCTEGTTAFLVYDLALYASLDQLIFDPFSNAHLDWNERHKIIIGVARVLLYLHEHAPTRIIHGDVKPRNILLDKSLHPKLSDLGLARHLAINMSDCVDVNIINGTMGYMALEYMVEGRLSTKADVFSFGLLVLEIISGHRNYLSFMGTNENFVLYVWRNWLKETCSNIIDPTVDWDSSVVTRLIHIGMLCVEANAADRPTMHDVVEMLLTNSSLPLPISPVSSWIMEENVPETLQSEDYDFCAVEEFLSELCPR